MIYRRTLVSRVALLGWLCALSACSCDEPTTSTDPVAPPVVAAPPGEPQPPSGPLTIGGPEVTFDVLAQQGFALTIATAGEYQIEATGAPLDVRLSVASGERVIANSGPPLEGSASTQLVTFLETGSHEVHAVEGQGRAATARVSVTQLAPVVPVATLAPGQPAAIVQAPAGDTARAASAEVTLTITVAGNYQIDAFTPDVTFDPELELIEHGALAAADSDSGDERNARIVRALTPGTYGVRVHDRENRAVGIVVTVALLP